MTAAGSISLSLVQSLAVAHIQTEGTMSRQRVSRTARANAARKKLAEDIRNYLLENLERKVTIRELADQFHISETQVKNSFKTAFDVTVHSWFRTQKMQAAAEDLCSTDLSVLEIAGKYGFDNGSKFAGAFRETFHMTPSAYRLRNSDMFRDN